MSLHITNSAPVELNFKPQSPHVSSIDKAYNDVSSFTERLAGFEATPFLLTGIMLQASRGQSDIAQVGRGMGKLMIIASPFIAVIKLLALPVLAGGAVATGVTGIAYGAEKLIDKIKGPSEAERERIQHTRHFVQRMREYLKTSSEEEKDAVEKSPGALIAISLLMVVFLSRNLEGNQIEDGNSVIHQKEIDKMDVHAKDYFQRVCKMKETLGELKLSPDNDHAWEYLSQSLDKIHAKTNGLQPFEHEALKKLITECDDLTKLIVNDDIFQAEWKNSK